MEKFYDKDRDYEDEKEKREKLQKELDKLKNEILRENKKNADENLQQKETEKKLKVEIARLEEKSKNDDARLIEAKKETEDTKNELTKREEELKLVRAEKENQIGRLEIKLDEKSVKIQGLTGQLANLQIESNNKDNEIKEKNDELLRKDEEIKRLKNRAGQTYEELLEERLRSKEERLGFFTTELSFDQEQVRSLRRYYERIIEARKNYNRVNIETHEDNIARVSNEIRQGEFGERNIQKLCRKCEKIAKLRVELTEIRQQQ